MSASVERKLKTSNSPAQKRSPAALARDEATPRSASSFPGRRSLYAPLLLRAGLFLVWGDSFQFSVFSFQSECHDDLTYCTLHTAHCTLVSDAADRAGVHRPLDPPVLRLIAPVPLPWDQSGDSAKRDLKLSTFSLNLWPLVWSLGPAPAACRIECRTTNALGHYRHWITVSIHTETGRSFMATACTCRHNRAPDFGPYHGDPMSGGRRRSGERVEQGNREAVERGRHLVTVVSPAHLLSCSPAPATLRRLRHEAGCLGVIMAHLYTICKGQIWPCGKKVDGSR